MTSNTISWQSIRNKVLADPKVKAEYDALETEFNLARQVISPKKEKNTQIGTA